MPLRPRSWAAYNYSTAGQGATRGRTDLRAVAAAGLVIHRAHDVQTPSEPQPAGDGRLSTRQRHVKALDRLRRLQLLTAALSHAVTSAQVADAIVTQGMGALDACVGVLAVLNEARTHFECLRVVGCPPEVEDAYRTFPADAPLPIPDAVRQGRPVILENLGRRKERYPGAGTHVARPGGAAVAIPMKQGDVEGGLWFAFPDDRTFDEDDRTFLATMAGLGAQALERARLYDAERAARERAEREVEERKAAERALRESEERLRTLGDNLPLGAVYQIVGDEAGGRRFAYVSAGVEGLFGVSPGEAVADAGALYGLIHDEDRLRVAADEEVALRGMAAFDCEFRSWTRAGELRWIHCRSAPRRLADGRVAWEGIVMDVTARKRAEEALREADRRKDEFLAMLGHELRNPLAPIRNAAEVLRLLGPADPRLQKAGDVIARQVAHMTRLVDDLLDVSRITRGKVTLHMERIDLAAVVAAAVEHTRPLFEARRHRLAVELPPETVWLEGDKTRLAQVLGNLLTNAAKYSEEGGEVRLTAARDGGEAVVLIRDGGVGIPPDFLPHVFDLFTQGQPTLARSQGGLGVGLTVVRRLVELHGGRVEAHSEGPGRGSEFVVRLPLPPDGGRSGSPTEGAAPRPAPARRVLVVDDDRDGADSLAMLLRVGGHQVAVAYDGPGAVAAAREFLPDVVLLDLGLPGMSGYEVAARLRQEPALARTLLAAVTGYGQEEDRRRARSAGFAAHLVKPAAPEALHALLAGSGATP